LLGATWRTAAAVSVLATVAIHLAFYKALRIPLPWGLLESYAF
jgi:putative tricarboxylic transport membrane protein